MYMCYNESSSSLNQPEEENKMAHFNRLDKVKKVRGYKFDGLILGDFITTKGLTRYVVELEGSGGMLHIFRPEDLELREDNNT